MQKKQVKKEEAGRTMVEMLGTLAIIGVLSVGGVTGYNRAIKTYRTNSAIETAQRQAAIVAGDIGLGQAVSPGSTTVLKAPSGYEVAAKDVAGGSTDINSTTPFFGVEIGGGEGSKIPTEVARDMLERAIGEWKNVHAFGVKSGDSVTWLTSTGGFDTAVGNAKTVIIIVVYMSDLSPRTGDLKTTGLEPPEDNSCNPACDAGLVCNNGTCECPNGEEKFCATKTVDGVCTSYSCCDVGAVPSGGDVGLEICTAGGECSHGQLVTTRWECRAPCQNWVIPCEPETFCEVKNVTQNICYGDPTVVCGTGSRPCLVAYECSGTDTLEITQCVPMEAACPTVTPVSCGG